ncbi:hypothetical protein PV10_05326 [Exophiala mesophila]|uniref:Uncharacterized protein n=1 Tax=Exophiala mesophila TaxID=212818 RepID=A0A0D1ZV46_EXOME|nr:uncharacterized protein PV10_05326 [Exophiala mesophila]KIV90698.1 hypothetical protein PV10_05326 [Exophiala mesophila]
MKSSTPGYCDNETAVATVDAFKHVQPVDSSQSISISTPPEQLLRYRKQTIAPQSQISTTTPEPPHPSIFSPFTETLHLFSSLVGPYIFNPLLALQVYHPRIATMWPFDITTSFNPSRDIRPLTGKVILVTGGNNGLGKETILQLAQHSPKKIFLAARSESKALAAVQDIKSHISDPNLDIQYLPLDLESFPSIKAAADKVTSSTDRLDILVLNAGIMATPPGLTPQGHDTQLGTNHLGHFLLTKLLLPTLIKTASQPSPSSPDQPDVRIISLSSEAHNMSPPIKTITSTSLLTATNPWTRYGASKAANILFASELARRHPNLTSVSVHPGIIKTDLYIPNTNSNFLVRYGTMIFGPLMFQTVQKGALNQIWAAVAARSSQQGDGGVVNGAYYTPVGILRKGNKWSQDADAARQLWEWSEAELKKSGF